MIILNSNDKPIKVLYSPDFYKTGIVHILDNKGKVKNYHFSLMRANGGLTEIQNEVKKAENNYFNNKLYRLIESVKILSWGWLTDFLFIFILPSERIIKHEITS